MDLTVLGNSSRYLAPLGAGTSYLVRHKDTRLLLDCGNGTHLRLARELGDEKLSGVLVSHFHVDNVSDLFPVVFSLPLGAPLLVPKGALPRLADLLRAYSMDRTWLQRSLIQGVSPGAWMDLGDVRLSFAKAGHGCPGVATRIEADGASLVYLADTGPRAWLADFARGADVLVAHTLLLDRDASPAAATNMTAGEAGRLARDAGVGTLALSHIPFYGNVDASVEEAQREFGGKVLALHENARVMVPLR